MKSVILSFAATFCFIASASAQNEVPGVPNNRNASADENVHAPVQMDRQTGTQVQQQDYNSTDPQHTPEPGTIADPAHRGHDHNAMPGHKHDHPHTDPATKPKSGGTMNRKPAGK